MEAKIHEAKKRAEDLLNAIKSNRDKASDSNLKNASNGLQNAPKLAIKVKRTLKGHTGKIYALHWAEDSPFSLVSAGQDGVLLVWDAMLNCKTHCFLLRCAWVMTCCFAPSSNFAACGGLDNNCSIFSLQSNSPDPIRELEGHGGHLSSCRFINNSKIITSSGDKTCCLWDIESGVKEAEFTDHSGDVLSVAIAPDNNYFVTGSLDRTSRVYDIREKRQAQITYRYHAGDVNSVCCFPGGNAFATASEDKTCRIFDIRAAGELIVFGSTQNDEPPVGSVAFSKSGKYLFSSQLNGIRVWDSMKGNLLDTIKPHKDIISSIGVSGDGKALGSSSWDLAIKVLA